HWLVAHGVPEADLTLDRRGHRTAATMANASAMGLKQALGCTQPYHLPRAPHPPPHPGHHAVRLPARPHADPHQTPRHLPPPGPGRGHGPGRPGAVGAHRVQTFAPAWE